MIIHALRARGFELVSVANLIGKTRADCSIDCADELEQALARANGRVCAVILEPGVQAAAGMLVLP